MRDRSIHVKAMAVGPCSAATARSGSASVRAIVAGALASGLAASPGCAEDPPAPPTWTEIAPIVARCAGCHDGSAAPVPLRTYGEHAALGPMIQNLVETREMPPWRAGPADVAYRDDPSLTDTEISAIARWVEADSPLGDGDPDEVLVAPAVAALDHVDATLAMPEPYLPSVFPDDNRCFVLDRSALGDVYVTGLKFTPSNLAAAHHMLAYTLTPSDPEATPAIEDAADPGPGYACGQDASGTKSPGARADLAGWLPGKGAIVLPDGEGIHLGPDAMVVLSAHYYLPASDGLPDQTTIDLTLADHVDRRAAQVKVTSNQWKGGKDIAVAAGSTAHHEHAETVADVVSGAALDATNGVMLDRVLLHMHVLGAHARLTLERAGQPTQTLLYIPDWDYDWQLEYWLEEPLQLLPTDTLRVACDYANPTDADVWWGEDTADEMCIGKLLVSERP